eukprot:PhF_6_TR491/c0_g1_i1/m.244/K01524/ppx-gppA; exopolyphosphatase / guanosine-5'-triphosphate,3'-diphosphate pyrophosphatase
MLLEVVSSHLKSCQLIVQENNSVTTFRAFGTAALRNANNGSTIASLLQTRFNIPVTIIDQNHEGILGYRTAMALLPPCAPVAPEDVVVWDSGGASFQLTTKQRAGGPVVNSVDGFQVFLGLWGNSRVLKTFLQDVQLKPFDRTNQDPHPCTIGECEALQKIIIDDLTPLKPSWLSHLSNTTVIGIGTSPSMFYIAKQLLGKATFTAADIWNVLTQKIVGRTTEEFVAMGLPTPTMIVTKLVLIYSVMVTFEMRDVIQVDANGSTVGMLLSHEL